MSTELERGSPVVSLIAGDGLEETARNVIAHAPRGVPLALVGEAPRIDWGGRDPIAVGSESEVAAACAPADLVLVRAGCTVSGGWLEGLRDAAMSDSVVATASALADDEDEASLDERARRVAAGSLRLRPRLAAADGNCTYVRRPAMDLAGPPDAGFSERCLLNGLSHVLADDVLVTGGKPDALDAGRHPPGALARAVAAARRATRGLSVTIDCRHLQGAITGIQLHTLELIHALRQAGGVRLRAVVSQLVSPEARSLLQGVELLEYDELGSDVQLSDVAHRPYQVTNDDDLRVMRLTGERFVITHHDLIAYRNPGYFQSEPAFDSYRSLTRRALAAADRAVFVSAHAAADAAGEDLIDDEHSRVVHNGVDHSLVPAAEPARPAGVPDGGFLLCIGTDYRHKNRLFALRLLAELRSRHAFEGGLVLAGPRIEHGSTRAEERALLEELSELAGAVVTLGPVGEAEKAWLYQNAAALVYPTVYEGFGLIPFEAASAGLPCLFAPQAALAEVLPADTAILVPWDAARSAERAAGVLGDTRARKKLVNAVSQTGESFTWKATAEAMLDVYAEAAAAPHREAAGFADEAIRLRTERDHFEHRFRSLREEVGDDGLSLVGRGGLLPVEMRRPLMAVASRPTLAEPVFGAIRLLYRLGRTGRRAS